MSEFPNIFAIARDKYILLGDAFTITDCRACTISVYKNLNDWEIEEFEKFLSLMSTVVGYL